MSRAAATKTKRKSGESPTNSDVPKQEILFSLLTLINPPM
jgi:hypothetical protein